MKEEKKASSKEKIMAKRDMIKWIISLCIMFYLAFDSHWHWATVLGVFVLGIGVLLSVLRVVFFKHIFEIRKKEV